MSPLSLYAHVPLCLRKCAYCDFFSLPLDLFPGSADRADASSRIAAALSAEISARAREWSAAEWHTVYVGGGTPSLLSPRDIASVCESITASAHGAKPAEWTVEANPEDITPEWLDACRDSGVNRLSVGMQSLDDRCCAGVGRRGSAAASLAALALARRRWNGSVSADLISGLPFQTEASLADDIAALADTGCDHVSLYSLTLEEGTPLSRSIADGRGPNVPSDDAASDLWLFGRDELERRGYLQYEVSNFAREGRESAHNKVYWRMGSWIGIGPSATGNISRGDRSTRLVNANDVAGWLADPVRAPERQEVSREETVTETIMMAFRLREGIDRGVFFDRFGTDILDIAGKTIDRWERRARAEVTPSRVALTRDGLTFLNRFLSECMEETSR